MISCNRKSQDSYEETLTHPRLIRTVSASHFMQFPNQKATLTTLLFDLVITLFGSIYCVSSI